MSEAPAAARIRVRARLFAIQRELAGRREVPLELAPGATIDDAWAALVAEVPALAPGRSSVRFARNGDYADPTDTLEDRDELAVIPPVSGGGGREPDRSGSSSSARPRSAPGSWGSSPRRSQATRTAGWWGSSGARA